MALCEEWTEQVEGADTAMLQDPVLYQRCRVAMESSDQWTEQDRRLAEDYLSDMPEAGAGLDPDARGRLLEINKQLAQISVQVQDKLNGASRQELAFDRSRLAGMSEDFLQAANEGRQDGEYAVRMLRTPVEAILGQCQDRAVREQVFNAFNTRNFGGEHDTTALIQKMVALRGEKAQLLGHARYSDMVIGRYMAKTPEAVMQLVRDTWSGLSGLADREMNTLKERAAEDGVETLQPWDVAYYTNRVREIDSGRADY